MTFSNLTYKDLTDDSQEEQTSGFPPRGLSAAEHLLEIKSVFGRTTPRLCRLFGVSRDTFSKWLNAQAQPEAFHEEMLCELAYAARVFLQAGVRPSVAMFDRTVAKGKTFLQLLRQGESGAAMAERLVRIIKRDELSRARLDALLSTSAPSRVDPQDIGSPAFEEDTRLFSR